MKNISVSKIKSLKGEMSLPADKSISHRAAIMGSISEGETRVGNFLKSDDCLNTLEVFKKLGVDIKWNKDSRLIIKGRGLKGLKAPLENLYFGNSGTALRLTTGVLSGCPFKSVLTGDESLSSRPMKRITHPLRMMGANISGRDDGNYLPLEIKGGRLKAISYKSPIASAQVKSSILLAGLHAEGTTRISEPYKSRDHTERIFKFYGADIKVNGLEVSLRPGVKLKGRNFNIPADISSAAFLMVGASILEDSEICLKNVNINPTRTGIIRVLKEMQADIEIINEDLKSFEPTADIIIKSSKLKALKIKEEALPFLIDELPILMVAAAYAEGETVIENASELRVKETDRIYSMVTNLKKLGADIKNIKDDIVINGPTPLKGTEVESFKDHRTAMSMIIAGLTAKGKTTILDTECIETSFPNFMKYVGSGLHI